MIKSFQVEGLHGKRDVALAFHPDLNILTGKNGSGKTTLLKLMWYCLSGNLERAQSEILFQRAILETDKLKLKLWRSGEDGSELGWEIDINGSVTRSSEPKSNRNEYGHYISALLAPDPRQRLIDAMKKITDVPQSSIFFPTFRRIEGGYNLERRRRGRYLGDALQDAVAEFSSALDVGAHHFVASVSTNDIVALLTSKYAEVSGSTNALHVKLSADITKTIRDHEAKQRNKPESEKLQRAEETLLAIADRIEQIEGERDVLLKPFLVLTKLVTRILQHKGIFVTDAITFGEAAESITSDQLSAGEKQMLSFLCYNAFSEGASFFIDEPEISLHVDWQRTLFPTLQEQSTSNQFIISTHSPFIYSKYSDKELNLNPDRGTQ